MLCSIEVSPADAGERHATKVNPHSRDWAPPPPCVRVPPYLQSAVHSGAAPTGRPPPLPFPTDVGLSKCLLSRTNCGVTTAAHHPRICQRDGRLRLGVSRPQMFAEQNQRPDSPLVLPSTRWLASLRPPRPIRLHANQQHQQSAKHGHCSFTVAPVAMLRSKKIFANGK